MSSAVRARVLHVIESYGGGSATALVQHVRSTPDVSHHLLRRVRPDSYAANDEEDLFESVRDLGAGARRAVASVRAAVRAVDPDVVHAHSSFAGAFVRLAVWRGPLRVYTPHCFALERLDASVPRRALFVLAEVALGLNTDVYAACSPREASLARRLAPYRRSVVVPNVARVRRADVADPDRGTGRPVLCGMGRTGPQHDPEFFARVVASVRARRPEVRARWIGGGDPVAEARLTAAGVDVTGWVSQERAFQVLAGATVYVHTAAWDGAPMALLEATALEVPIVARATRALSQAPPQHVATTPEGVADAVVRVLSAGASEANVGAWASTFAACTPGRQREVLSAVYRPRRHG